MANLNVQNTKKTKMQNYIMKSLHRRLDLIDEKLNEFFCGLIANTRIVKSDHILNNFFNSKSFLAIL